MTVGELRAALVGLPRDTRVELVVNRDELDLDLVIVALEVRLGQVVQLVALSVISTVPA